MEHPGSYNNVGKPISSVPLFEPGAEELDPSLLNQEKVPSAGLDDADDTCGPSYFEEVEECRLILDTLVATMPARGEPERLLPTISEESNGVASLFKRLIAILERYQECPHLLLSHLELLLEPLVSLLLRYLPQATEIWARKTDSTAKHTNGDETSEPIDMLDMDAPKTAFHHASRAIYVIVKIVGDANCTSYFSNDAKLYEDVFYTLEEWSQDIKRKREWEVRYCLLLWLSSLVLVPFSLSIIDTNADADAVKAHSGKATTLSDAVLHMALDFLGDASKCRDAAALLVARLLTRPDSATHRNYFFKEYAVSLLSEYAKTKKGDTIHVTGVMLAMSKTLKMGQRHELSPFAADLVPLVSAVYDIAVKDSLLCQTAVKLQQRLVASTLKKRSAPWRYHRHIASLAHNLKMDSTVEDGKNALNAPSTNGFTNGTKVEEDDEGGWVSDQDEAIEEGIQLLLSGITHKDTIVRWCAARGIGLICERLPQGMASDVFDAVVGLFDQEQSDSDWHGALLTIAELCRRSILHPGQLSAIVPYIVRGLSFDLSRGTYSVGAHVRDAACYTCWSIARAYDPDDLTEHVHKLSTTLVVTALFDREVNVRRAAAAAFQECVGRLGNFPNGIELVTTMDFFSLASMKNSFQSVAPQVAKHGTYLGPMLEELMRAKLLHWDRALRHCAAVCLGTISVREETRVVMNEIVPELQRRVTDGTLATRHGAILGLSYLVDSLPAENWSDEHRVQLVEVITRLDAAHFFRSKGGEYLRQACARLMASCASKQLVLPKTVTVTKITGQTVRASTLGKVQVFFEDTFKQILEWLQLDAAAAYDVFTANYYKEFDEAFHGKVMNAMIASISGSSTSAIERRGFLAAIGSLPRVLLMAKSPTGSPDQDPPFYFEKMIDLLLDFASSPQPSSPLMILDLDVESRRNALRSIYQVVLKVKPESLSPTYFQKVLQCLLDSLQDYKLDNRGDVGSFVRLEGLIGLPKLIAYAYQQPSLMSANLLIDAVGGMLKQLVEKLDRIRSASGAALLSVLIDGNTSLPVCVQKMDKIFPPNGEFREQLQKLRDIIAAVSGKIEDWSSPSQVIQMVAPKVLLETPLFVDSLMEGLVISAGCLSAHVMQPAMQSLLQALSTIDPSRKKEFVGRLIEVGKRYEHNDRIIVPLCRTLDNLMNEGALPIQDHLSIVNVLRSELQHFSTSIQVILPLTSVLANLCRSSENQARKSAWSLALIMIASRYPKVRAKMATDLYTALLVLISDNTAESIPKEGCQKAMAHLIGTAWDGTDATIVRRARNELYEMLQIAPPTGPSIGDENGMDSNGTSSKKNKKVAVSYMHLVSEAGY